MASDQLCLSNCVTSLAISVTRSTWRFWPGSDIKVNNNKHTSHYQQTTVQRSHQMKSGEWYIFVPSLHRTCNLGVWVGHCGRGVPKRSPHFDSSQAHPGQRWNAGERYYAVTDCHLVPPLLHVHSNTYVCCAAHIIHLVLKARHLSGSAFLQNFIG